MGASAVIAAGNNGFVLFGPAHLVVMALTIIVPAGLAVACGAGRRVRTMWVIGWSLAIVLVVNEIVTYVHSWRVNGFDRFAADDLPLHLCGVACFMTAYILIKPHQLLYELAFFWGLAGTLQAIITPSDISGFPAYSFIRFFIAHSGIVAGVLFATWGMRMRPRLRGVMYTWLASNVMVVIIGMIDYLGRTWTGCETGWNYMFLCHKPGGPASDSPFFFVDWPWYIIALEPVVLAMYYLLYAPFPIAAKLRHRRSKASKEAGQVSA